MPVVLPALHNLSPLSRSLSFLSFTLRSTSGPPGILDAQTLTAHRGITSIRAFMRVFTSEYMHIHYSFSCALGYVTDTIWHKYLAEVWRSLKSAPKTLHKLQFAFSAALLGIYMVQIKGATDKLALTAHVVTCQPWWAWCLKGQFTQKLNCHPFSTPC